MIISSRKATAKKLALCRTVVRKHAQRKHHCTLATQSVLADVTNATSQSTPSRNSLLSSAYYGDDDDIDAVITISDSDTD